MAGENNLTSLVKRARPLIPRSLSAGVFSGDHEIMFTIKGVLVPEGGALMAANAMGAVFTVVKVLLKVNTPPTGQAIIVDIHKNGTTIFTNQANRPQIAAGADTGETTTIDVSNWNNNDYFTMDVDQVGSGTAGADLSVHIALEENGGLQPLTVKEIDGSPSVSNVDTIRVTNGTLTDDGNGQVTVNLGNAATDGSAIHDNEAGEIAAITEKGTPVDADMIIIEDSEDSNNKKMVAIGNLPGGGGAIADHDHSGDAGDGGTFDLTNLKSTGVSNGKVATADGADGITWETPSGGPGGSTDVLMVQVFS